MKIGDKVSSKYADVIHFETGGFEGQPFRRTTRVVDGIKEGVIFDMRDNDALVEFTYPNGRTEKCIVIECEGLTLMEETHPS